jgi:metal-responsive CopG/Arc/MetJ family transcriptional regulator
MEEIITSRFSEELVKKVDQAVFRGHFKSRSEALRVIVEEYCMHAFLPQLKWSDEESNLCRI